MKVYVAGASSEIERAEKWIATLREAGIEVTATWPEVIRKVGDANPMTASRAQRQVWSATDLSEVAHAEVFWFLLPEGRPTAGAYTEFGYAVFLGAAAQEARACDIPGAPMFWIVASGKETSIFTALADHFDTDEEAFRALTLRALLVGQPKTTTGSKVSLEAHERSSEGG
jgi:hypothetical protein